MGDKIFYIRKPGGNLLIFLSADIIRRQPITQRQRYLQVRLTH